VFSFHSHRGEGVWGSIYLVFSLHSHEGGWGGGRGGSVCLVLSLRS